VDEVAVTLRPVVEEDLAMFRRFAVEPGLIGLDWAGFRDAQAPSGSPPTAFTFEGVLRACEFRAGQWRDGYLYSRVRDDPAPAAR